MRPRPSALLVAAVVSACASREPPPIAAAPAQGTAPTSSSAEHTVDPTPSRDPFVLDGTLIEDPVVPPRPAGERVAISLPAVPRGVPAPSKVCTEMARRNPRPTHQCVTREQLLIALDAALAHEDSDERDTALAALEACAGAPSGLLRALRAELAPAECGDALAEPLLRRPPRALARDVHETLAAQALGARLVRVGRDMPPPPADTSKPRLVAHVHGAVADWTSLQEAAMRASADAAANFGPYGRGIVAIEAAMARLRMMRAARRMLFLVGADAERRAVFAVWFDDFFAVQHARAVESMLGGLGDFASLGAIDDTRVVRARTRLRNLQTFGAGAVEGNVRLLLPPMPPRDRARVDERLAARLPTFFAEQLLDPALALDADVLRALLDRGIPPAFRATLKRGPLSTEARLLWSRGRLLLGLRYWRPVDFDQAAVLARPSPRSDDATLLLALAIALRGGTMDARAMLDRAPRSTVTLGDSAALDAIAASKSDLAGVAMYDAAALAELASPYGRPDSVEQIPAAEALCVRYAKAAKKLTDPSQIAVAEGAARCHRFDDFTLGIVAADDDE